MMRVARLAIAAALVAMPSAGRAQWRPEASIGVSAATARLDRSGDPLSLYGLLLGASGRLAIGAFALELAYAQGTLSPEGSAAAAEDAVDGEAMLALAIRRWLVVAAVTHLRAIVTPAGTERWVRHEIRARTETDLVPGMMAVDAEAIVALVTDVNRVGEDHAARGVTIGVSLVVPESPLRLRLAYAIDRASSGAAVELLQAVTLQASLGRR